MFFQFITNKFSTNDTFFLFTRSIFPFSLNNSKWKNTKRRISLDNQAENTFVLVTREEEEWHEIHVGANRRWDVNYRGLVINTHIRK